MTSAVRFDSDEWTAITTAFGVPEPTSAQRAARKRKLRAQRIARERALRREGLTLRAIAMHVGVSAEQVRLDLKPE